MRTSYRTRTPSLLVAGVSLVFALSSILQAAAGAPDGTGFVKRWSPALVVCLLSAFCIARLARAGVFTSEEGIRILNPLRTVTVPWKRVRRFTLNRHRGFPGMGFVELLDGEPIEIWGIQARSRNPSAQAHAQSVVDALNEHLDTVRNE